MPQLALFDTGPRVLLDDASGLVSYTPDCIEAALAQRWFESLRADIPWRAERRQMYDREVDVPRLTAHFHFDQPTPALLLDAAERVGAVCGTRFNSVGLNYYRDGRDSVAPHNDHLYEIAEEHPIALLSLGATREMLIRAKQPPRRLLKIDLEPGSLLLMSYTVQLHYDHGIPKTRNTVGPRISLAFRVKPDRR